MVFSRKRIKILAVLAATGIFLFVAMVCFVGALLCAPHPAICGSLPSDIKGENVHFHSDSGSDISGWFIPGQAGRGVIILMHGVRGKRTDMLDRARFLSKAGFGVLLFDFQAHGESRGEHITFGYLESRDAQAAVSFVHHRLPGEKIAVIGSSLGGAACVLARPALAVDAMVLEMVYPTIELATKDRLALRFGKLANTLTPLLTCQLHPRLGIYAEDLRPIERVADLHMPKLFIAGTEDRHTTFEEAQELFDRASGPKEFWPVKGAAHINLHAYAKQEYETRVLEFLRRTLGGETLPEK